MMINLARSLTMGTALLLASAGAMAGYTATKPLAISAVIQESVGPMARCASQFGGTITGHANSAELGRVVLIGTDCITPSGPLFNFAQGRMIITTITGEQLYAEYSGQFVPTGEGAKFVFNNTSFQITGGTGRYWRASGGGTLTGGEDMVTGAGTAELVGKITMFNWQ